MTSIYQVAAADADGVVHRLAPAGEDVSPLVQHTLAQHLAAWPAPPFVGAQLRVGPAGLFWHDPRTAEQRSADARTERDTLLAATDWRVTRALEQGSAVPSAWASYRQQLRDLPQQAGFPDSITWPTPPTA